MSRAARYAVPACVAVQLVLLLAQARDVIRAMASDADASSPLVMGHDAALYPDSLLVAGNYPWWNGLWATQLLQELPASTQTTNYLPYVITLASFGLIAWLAWRLFGTSAAVVAGAVTLATGSVALVSYASWSARALSWWAMVAGAALVVALARPWPTGRTAARRYAAALLVCAYTAVAVACDQLVWVTALLPLAVVAIVFAVARAWRSAVTLAAVVGGASILQVAVRAVAENAGYRSIPKPVELIPIDRLDDTLANALVVAARLFTPGGEGDLRTLIGYAGGVAVAAAVVFAVRGGLRAVRGRGEDGLDGRAWIVFWAVALLGGLAAFLGTDASGPIGAPVDRYLYSMPFAVAALLAAAIRGGRWVPAIAVVGLVATAAAVGQYDESQSNNRPALRAITTAMEQYDLDRGYVSYWSAAPMRHATNYRYEFVPTGNCTGDRLCTAPVHYISGYYDPRPGTRTFLLVDAADYAVDGYLPAWVTRAPAELQPERVIPISATLQMLVYDFDLAEQIIPGGQTPE